MVTKLKIFLASAAGWVTSTAAVLLLPLTGATDNDQSASDTDATVDPDFEGWLHGDPTVTKNPASRYGDRTPGYITGNGLGSMEIGAADD